MAFACGGEVLLVQNQHEQWDGPDGGVNDGTNGSGEGGLTIFTRDTQSGMLSEPSVGPRVPQCMAVAVLETRAFEKVPKL
eukprot:SAG11_NODE_470_length_9205_cov_4.727872_3_plen_80_part_00